MTETATHYDKVLTAIAVWREARSQSYAAKLAVYHVINNRITRKFRGSDAASVITWPLQFSSFNRADPNVSKLPIPGPTRDWDAWLECCEIVDNPGEDPTHGALFYHSLPSAEAPKWAHSYELTAEIDAFKFYRT